MGQRAAAGRDLSSVPAEAIDAGALPGTQVVTLTVFLAPPAERASALDGFLTVVQTPGSPQYHRWLTPESFAKSFGATAEQVGAVQAWANRQGFRVGAVSASGISLTVTGPAAQVEAALSPGLHAFQVNGQRYQTNTSLPSVPDDIAADVLAIGGLNTVPPARPTTIHTEAGLFAVTDLLTGVGAAVEANTSRILSVASSVCVEDVDPATTQAMHLLLKEAAAQGITTLAASGCNGRGSGSYPGAETEVLSVATAPGITPANSPMLTELRPAWQSAPGLPLDGFRHEPDLTVSSLAGLENAVAVILSKAQADGANPRPPRLGNIAGTLYTMGPIPDLFKQPDGAAAGTWEAATGLGITDLSLLVKKYATGTNIAQVQIVPQSNTSGTNLYSIPYGADETYKITVTGGQGTPSGAVTVSFSPGGYSYTVALAADGTGVFQLSQLATQPPAGQSSGTGYKITATYSGDNSYAAGAYNETNLYVNAQPITISAVATPTAGTLYTGSPYQVVATLSAGSTTPSGSLTFTPSAGTAQTINFPQNAGSNTVTANFLAPVAGTITIQLTCTASANYVCNTPANTSIPVYKATPGISPVQITNQTPQSATFTVTLTGASAGVAPSGQVTFTDAGNNTLCTTPMSSSITGPVSCSATNFAGAASGTVTATYNGDDNYNFVSSSSSYNGAAVTTKTTLAAITSPVIVGATVNLVATITPASTLNNTPPSGTITFYDGGVQIAQQNVANNQTSYTAPVSLNTQGTRQIYAAYSGDANYGGSMSATQSVTVGPTPSVVLSISPTGNVVYGNVITLTAAISAAPNNGAGTLTGSIKFNIDGTDHVTQTVGLTGATGTGATATLKVTQALDVGTYFVNLYCTGTNFDCSSFNNNGFTFTVVKADTATALQVNPSAFAAGAGITATATVSPLAAPTGTNGAITGTVTFYDNATNVGTVALYASNGSVVAPLTFTVSGASDNIVAVYNGDGNNNSSKSVGTASGGGGTTTPAATSITVAATPTTALAGAVVTLTATVVATPPAGSTPAGSPSGTVNFYSNSNGATVLLGSASLSGLGANTATATYSTTGLRAGANVISASFVGSSGFSASATTAAVTVQITDYTVSFTPTAIGNLPAGQSTKVAAAINAVNGFAGQVVLGCSAPAGSAMTCTFDPAVIQTSGLSTLTVGTTVRAALATSHAAVEAAMGAVGATLLVLLLPAVRRRRLPLRMLVSLVMLGSALGCTELRNPATGSGLSSGTPAGTQILTITTSGTDGVTTVRHNYQIAVTVQ